jgi:hypothetical protein
MDAWPDAEHEDAYRVSSIGRLDNALDEARRRAWPVVDRQADLGACPVPLAHPSYRKTA